MSLFDTRLEAAAEGAKAEKAKRARAPRRSYTERVALYAAAKLVLLDDAELEYRGIPERAYVHAIRVLEQLDAPDAWEVDELAAHWKAEALRGGKSAAYWRRAHDSYDDC